MLDQGQRTTILELQRQGHGKRRIAWALGISRATVRQVIASASDGGAPAGASLAGRDAPGKDSRIVRELRGQPGSASARAAGGPRGPALLESFP